MNKYECWLSIKEICDHFGANIDTVKNKICLLVSLIENVKLRLVKLMNGYISRIV